MKKWLKRILIGLSVILVVSVGGFLVYVQDYYKANAEALNAYQQSTSQSSSVHAFLNDNSTVGVIFYPGGKVEGKAYSPLLLELSQQGINVFLVDMPFNLAVFDIGAADRVMKLNPTIKTWYLAGHSLGGAMAFSHFASYEDDYAGIILLAAYPLSDTDKPVLILKGSNDEVLDPSKLNGFDYISIQGGNHAQFGSYGPQAGDGTATITPYQQRTQTIQAILSFIETKSP